MTWGSEQPEREWDDSVDTKFKQKRLIIRSSLA